MDRDEYAKLLLPEAELRFHRNPEEGVVYVTVKWPANEHGHILGFKFPVNDDLLLERVMRGAGSPNTGDTVAEVDDEVAQRQAFVRSVVEYLLPGLGGDAVPVAEEVDGATSRPRGVDVINRSAAAWRKLAVDEACERMRSDTCSVEEAMADLALQLLPDASAVNEAERDAREAIDWSRVLQVAVTCDAEADHDATKGNTQAAAVGRVVARALRLVISDEPGAHESAAFLAARDWYLAREALLAAAKHDGDVHGEDAQCDECDALDAACTRENEARWAAKLTAEKAGWVEPCPVHGRDACNCTAAKS